MASHIEKLIFAITLCLLTQLSCAIRISTILNPTRPSLSKSDQQSRDVHELLPFYGLPKGLIPNNVIAYDLADEGDFTITLEHSCYVQFDDLVYYDKKIKGKLSFGLVSDVVGIQAKKLFVWVPITGLKADEDSGSIEFFVGVLSQKLPADQFEAVPTWSELEERMNERETDGGRRKSIERRAILQEQGEDINELAEAFIKNFRNQLRIQRIESFERYQDMLARST
ncbi:Protein of unknown function DUF761, plant [Dillenia turbinata]|uniref:Uncharacterized protein n=1 Tax=Dillenia turbinata TaxID=194707 RepID=A0AAN8ZGN7_9MAGN